MHNKRFKQDKRDYLPRQIQLIRMGADIELYEPSIVVNGGVKLSGADVQASDLRAGAALVIAGAVAEGVTDLHRIYHIERGYEDFVSKLNKINIKTTKENDDIL